MTSFPHFCINNEIKTILIQYNVSKWTIAFLSFKVMNIYLFAVQKMSVMLEFSIFRFGSILSVNKMVVSIDSHYEMGKSPISSKRLHPFS